MSEKQRGVLFLGSAFVVCVVLLFPAKVLLFHEGLYREQYVKNGAYATFGREEVDSATEKLLAFLKTGDGLETPFFNEREKRHMEDVRGLYRGGLRVLYGSLLGFLVVCGVVRKRRSIGAMLVGGSSAAVFLLILLLLLVVSDFSVLFTLFHQGAFSNDLWQLNPATDNMAVLFPESFFMSFVMTSSLYSGVMAALMGGMGIVLRRAG